MNRSRWTNSLVMGAILVVMGCNPAQPPTATTPEGEEKRGGKSTTPKASPKPVTTSPEPVTSPSAGAGASPTTSVAPSTATSTAPASTAPSTAASVAPSASPTSLATTNPTLASLGCKPVGTESPLPGGGTKVVAAVYGHDAVPALNIQRATAVTLKAPPPVNVVLTAHPGSPAGRIAAYEIGFLSGPDGATTQLGTNTMIAIPAIDLPAAPATHFGRPVAVPVVLPVGQLKPALADVAALPTQVRATIRFYDEKGVVIPGKSNDPLEALVAVPLTATATAAALPTTEACAGATPAPFVPAPLVPGAGVNTAVMAWREVSPNVVIRAASGVLSQTNVGIALAAPPGGTGVRVDSMEATYVYTTEADVKAGKPPTNAGSVVTNLTPPVVVAAGTATAYGASAFATLPFSDAMLAGLKGAEGVVVVTFIFKSDEGGIIDGPDGEQLKVTIPILVE